MPPRTETELRDELADLIQAGQLIPAVKEVKNWYKIGLKEAKDLMDEIRYAAGYLRATETTAPSAYSSLRKAVDRVLDARMGEDHDAAAARKKAMEAQMTALADAIADRVADQIADAVADKLRKSCTSCGAVPW